ncbi:MAG: hypothetical protein O3C57_00715 [Verrucomicrobia bacterium]|nr:hypothetical protein [Verrucomicrobiota bacterium]
MTIRIPKKTWGIGAAGFCLLAGCVTMNPARIDPTIMRYHNWWNHYERGQTRLAAGDLQGAQEDFENCLGLRREAKFSFPEEHWRVRTYGMHFLNAYFPHRELGICHFLRGDLTEARKYLLKSLTQEPSGRAKHYMNQVEMQALKQQRVPPPVIDIQPESLIKITNARKRILKGRAQGVGHIRDLDINQTRKFIELAMREQPFQEEITLRSGLNRIQIAATDLAGQTSTRVVEWVADWEPPAVTITKAAPAPGGWTLQGLCADSLMLSEVSIETDVVRRLDAQGKMKVAFDFTLRKGGKAVIHAADSAGNIFAATFDEESLGLEKQVWLYERALAMAPSDETHTDGRMLLAAQTPVPAPDRIDRLKPSFKISADSRRVSEIFREDFFLSGEARDAGGLASVSINGEALLEHPGALQHFFARRLPLDGLGVTNQFELVAVDTAGNTSTKSFRVVMRSPEYLNDKVRLTLGIPPVSAPETMLKDADTVRVELEDALVEWPARFNVVAREENWDKILTEQKLSMSALSDPRAALQIGKIVTAELFLMGRLIEEANGTTIYLSVVDIDQGRVIAGTDVYTENIDDFRNRQYYVSGLARKVEQEFPFIQGRIEDVSGTSVIIDVGSEQGVTRGMRFVVLEGAHADDTLENANVRFFTEQWIQLAIKQTKSSQGVAEVLPGSAKRLVQKGDFVVTR